MRTTTPILSRLLGWEGFSFVALSGIGLGLLGMDEFAKADLFFLLSAIALIIRIWTAVGLYIKSFSIALRLIGMLLVIVLFWRTILWVDHRRQAVEAAAKPTQPAPTPIYIGCSIDHIPVHIMRGSTIHVIRLFPGLTQTLSPNFQTGVLEDVSATDKDLDWPSTQNGRWLTEEEINSAEKANEMPMPLAFKCTATSGKQVDDVSLKMVVSTLDNKRHPTPVAIDPLGPTTAFSFYVTNACPVSIFADFEGATARPIDEPQGGPVPIRVIKRAWPGDLMVFQPTEFHWNDRMQCDWN